MAVIGYARVSSSGQSLDVQTEQLRAAGCAKVFSEKRSGATQEGREQLELALDYVREGDVFIVTRLDRLARSLVDLKGIADRLNGKAVGLRVLQQGGLIDTTSSMGKVLLGLMGLFAEFEMDLRRERQLEGITKAKAEGRYKGRPPSLDPAAVRRLRADGIRPAQIARQLGIARSSVYRLLEEDDPDGSG